LGARTSINGEIIKIIAAALITLVQYFINVDFMSARGPKNLIIKNNDFSKRNYCYGTEYMMPLVGAIKYCCRLKKNQN